MTLIFPHYHVDPVKTAVDFSRNLSELIEGNELLNGTAGDSQDNLQSVICALLRNCDVYRPFYPLIYC